MIRVVGVKKYFNKRKANEVRAIDDTTVELGDTGLVAFLGNSGCGKTTLLNAIGGLDHVDQGEIYIDGERITKRSSSKRDEIRNVNIGYIFQNYNLIEDKSVYENVAFVLKMIGFTNKAAIERRVMYVLERLNIAKYRNRPVKMLSGGERQRVGIARALVKNPKIIIADEPTGNLDSGNTLEVMNIIKAISKDKLVILVTHEKNIAYFYADRIVQIVDGKIASDQKNEHDGALDYRLDTKIYLKDMPYHEEAKIDGVDVKIYGDKKPMLSQIRIVIQNNNLYVDTGDLLTQGTDVVDIVDEHYEGVTKESYEKYRFDYADYFGNAEQIEGIDVSSLKGNVVPRKLHYHSVYGVFSSLLSGFKKIHSYSKIKKILLLGFAFASMFVIYAMSNAAGITHLEEERFVTTNKNYISLSYKTLTPGLWDEYAKNPEMDVVLPGNGEAMVGLVLDEYLQTTNNISSFSGIVAAASSCKEEDLLAGRLPQNNREILIDQLLYEEQLESNYMLKGVGIFQAEELVGKKLKVNYLGNLEIVGVTKRVEPCIYVDQSIFLELCLYATSGLYGDFVSFDHPIEVGTVLSYSLLEHVDTIQITKGEAPKKDYEVLIPEEYEEEFKIGDVFKDLKINQKDLVVCGYYKDARAGMGLYVNENTALYNQIQNYEAITLSPKDKEATLENLKKQSGIQYVDHYAEDKERYEKQREEKVTRTVVMAAVMISISLIEIYLMLRASFLSRVKEVGVLRAIGLKKREIYLMFLGEIVAITVITAIPAMLFMAYIVNAMIQVPYIGSMYRMDVTIFMASFLLVLFFHSIAGLLPVFTTLRKTPAAILSRNDVN